MSAADDVQKEHHISLLDQTADNVVEEEEEERQDAELSDSEAPHQPSSPITPKVTRNASYLQQSLARELTKRKYAKYDREHYNIAAPQDEEGEAGREEPGSYLENARLKAKSILKRKHTLGTARDSTNTVIDILYENQRGAFFFGIPKYSSDSLLPSDPRPWQNAQFRTSPVDIRNAQVPDPSWEWAWKGWYVDMSRDVDEQGWEYSFQFSPRWAWHGNHPWFHSFVRRRRWLRMRRRRDGHHHTLEEAHEFTADYFTIHPRMLKAGSEHLSRATSTTAKLEEEELDVHTMEITSIASLMLALKKAPVDREKVVAVRKFLNSGGEELHYLSSRMPDIMSLFIYQSSRRQLLADLLHRHEDASQRKQSLSEHSHDNDSMQKDHEAAVRHAENLHNAVHAADEQIKRLEYWSDIKGMAKAGETLSTWSGLSPGSPGGDDDDDAFASKQAASEGFKELHRHAEHDEQDCHDEKGKAKDATQKGKGKEKDVVEKASSVWFDSRQSAKTKESSEDTRDYSTAAESASELRLTPGASSTSKSKVKSNSKSRLSNVDGVQDPSSSAPEEEAYETNPAPPASQTVKIIDPVPVAEEAEEAPIHDSSAAPTTTNTRSSVTSTAKAIAAIASGGNEGS